MRLLRIAQIVFLSEAILAATIPIKNDVLIQKRQLQSTANDALSDIASQLGLMTKKVDAFVGDEESATKLLDSATAVLNAMKNGEEKVGKGEDLGIGETVVILVPLFQITDAVNKVMESLTKKRPEFDKIGLTFVIGDELELFNIETKKLIGVVVAKLPAFLPAVAAQPFYQTILDRLSETAAAFKTGDNTPTNVTLPNNATSNTTQPS
jgi:hypothetical protein